MKKEQAVQRLLGEYPNGRKYEKFFRDVVNMFAGDSEIVNSYCYDQIIRYLNSLS